MATPWVTATSSPSATPSVTLRAVTVRSGFSTYTNDPPVPRCTATAATTVAPRLTSTSRRALTNWLGNRPRSVLANCALSRTVPVVGSIWLSTVRSVPEDSLRRISRSKASTGSRSPRRSLSSTAGRLSSASVNSTAIGCTSVITTIPVVSLACTMLPASTSRRPTRPPSGAVIRQYVSCSFALSIAPWSDLTTPSSWRTSAAWVSTCCEAMESWAASR